MHRLILGTIWAVWKNTRCGGALMTNGLLPAQPYDTGSDEKGAEIEREIPFLKGYTVFTAEQCEGLPAQYSAKAEPPGRTRRGREHRATARRRW